MVKGYRNSFSTSRVVVRGATSKKIRKVQRKLRQIYAARSTKIQSRNRRNIKSGNLRPELKYFDVYANQNSATPSVGTITSSVALTTTWQFQQLTWIDQGVTSRTRVGLKCRLKRHIMNISIHNVADQLQNEYRFVIFLWQDEDVPQDNGAGNDPLAIFANQSPITLLNPTPPGGKFKILYDSLPQTLPPSDTTAGFANRSRKLYQWNKSMNVIAEYGTNNGVDYHKGQLFIAFIASAANNYTMYYHSRVRFTDD